MAVLRRTLFTDYFSCEFGEMAQSSFFLWIALGGNLWYNLYKILESEALALMPHS